MNVSIERLRFWLLAGASLLVIVIVSFLGYAHYRTHRYLRDLPKKLGVDVRRETNNVTYSQSVQGRTVYTIHAAKAVERSDGKMTLHDVGIVLYGRKQDRADRIYGQEFEYDQKNEIIRAEGEVHIDLQAPAAADANAKMDYAAGKDLHGGQDAGVAAEKHGDDRLIHVTTSGLVFLRRLGVAATDKDIEFASGGMTGHAVGADYSSDTGVVVLHTAVKVNGLQHDRPVVLTASHAVLDRPGQTITLSKAKYVAIGNGGRGDKGSAEGQTAEAEHVLAHLRRDGSVERLEAEGDVTLTGAGGESVKAPRGEMTLNAQNQPQSAVMSGGVKYKAEDSLRQAQGEASEGRVLFDKKGHPEHVVMTEAVHLHERVRASDAPGEMWSDRELNARTVELALAADVAGKAQLRDAKAAGDARLTVVSAAAKGGAKGGKSGMTSSALAGDVLTAHFVRVGSKDHLAEVHGDGHTALRRVSATGVVNTGTGDSLVAHFRPVMAGAAGRGSGGSRGGQQGKKVGFGGGAADEVSDAVEQGHVVMTRISLRKPGEATSPLEERATAERAAFDGALERTTLTGSVQLSDGTSVLWADRVVTEQQTGDAAADGSVKATYRQAGSAEEPVHVLAARAELKHDSQIATFYGGRGSGAAGSLARLWQGGSQVEAPVLQFERIERRLLARGEGQGAPMAVHTVLVSSGSSGASAKTDAVRPKAPGKLIAGGRPDVVRVASRELVYSDEARKAEFTGGVDVESRDGNMRGQQVVVYLQPAQTGTGKGSALNSGKAEAGKTNPSAAGGSGFMAGSVERMVATGHIDMEQPGRRATGEQVVYTASDGMFILTGTPTVLPKVIDDQRGTVTGTSLRFHSGDDNVVVSNGGENGTGERVRTETRVKNKQ